MAQGENINGVTSYGFEYDIESDRFDDYEVFEKLCALDRDENNIALVTEVYEALLGSKQYKALKDFMRDKSGRISTRAMIETLKEILNNENDDSVKK